VHISALAERFVTDPHQVVKSGELVKVKVLEVDQVRKRIALSMRLGDPVPQRTPDQAADARRPPRAASGERAAPSAGRQQRQPGGGERAARGGRPREQAGVPASSQPGGVGGAMADAFAKAKRR
jgi:uncharacterized protein